MLERIKEALGVWRTELDKLEGNLEKKLQRLAFLQEAPLPPDEIADYIIDIMLRHGQTEFHRHLEQKLGPAVNDPLSDPDETHWRPGLMTKITQPHDVDPWCLMWVLREPLKLAIREEILNWEGMPQPGPSRADRESELPKLETGIAKLREQIETAREDARSVGVDAAQIHQRKPVPRRPRDLKR